MKTTGLTFQEALKALVDEKCKEIVHTMTPNTKIHMGIDGVFYTTEDRMFAVRLEHFTSEWSIINPVQEYEEVEVVRWCVMATSGDVVGAWNNEGSAKNHSDHLTGSHIIKMTGIDRVPKKEKVTRRVEVDGYIDGAGYIEAGFNNFEDFVGHPDTHGKTGKLIFEWEE